MIKKIISILLLASMWAWLFSQGIKRQEVRECKQWARQAKTLKGFYVTDWQQDQCRVYKIKVGNQNK